MKKQINFQTTTSELVITLADNDQLRETKK